MANVSVGVGRVTGLVRTLLSRATREPRRVLSEGIRPDERVSLRTRLAVGAALLWRELLALELTVRAASTAYTLVFALIPLVTTSLAFFTAFPGLSAERDRIESTLFEHLLPGAVRSVEDYIDRFASRAAAAGAVSSLVFFVVVLMLFRSVEDTFNRIWKAERPRTWGERITVLALFLVFGSVAVTAMVVVSSEGRNVAARYPGLESTYAGLALQRAVLGLFSLASSWALFVVANKALPNARVRWGPAVLGGVVAGTLWHVLKGLFTWYVTDVASYENIYGAVGIVPAFFTWIYLTVLLLLGGGTVAFVAQNLGTLVAMQRQQSTRGPQLAYHAVTLAAALARAFKDERPPPTTTALAAGLGIAEYVVTEALHPLVCGGVVLAVPRGAEQAYAFAVPPENVSLGRVVALATGEDLCVPDDAVAASALRARVHGLFCAARSQEGSALERETIAALATDAPVV